ncbi:hypothetical protein [Bartonella sp. DGB2]|uniref:hypothetical protein n=1 Tax=Bartonella sp. DGB2 TaxID=3388426 RepID=UPI00399025F6
MMKIFFCFTLLTSLCFSSIAFAADCTEVGKRVARQQNGKLARSTPEMQSGRNVCVVVVLIPAHDGEKPRRMEITAPAD